MQLLPSNLAAQALALYLADGDDAVIAIQALYAPVTEVVKRLADLQCGSSDDEITVAK